MRWGRVGPVAAPEGFWVDARETCYTSRAEAFASRAAACASQADACANRAAASACRAEACGCCASRPTPPVSAPVQSGKPAPAPKSTKAPSVDDAMAAMLSAVVNKACPRASAKPVLKRPAAAKIPTDEQAALKRPAAAKTPADEQGIGVQIRHETSRKQFLVRRGPAKGPGSTSKAFGYL